MRQSIGHEEGRTNDSLENSILSIEDCGGSSESGESGSIQTNSEISQSTSSIADSRSQELPGIRRKPGVENKVELIEKLIENMLLLLCVPFESSCHCQAWVNNHNLFIYDSANTEYKLAASSLQRRTALLSFSELLTLHNNSPNPTYYARNNQHYLSLEESIDIVEKLLDFQYKDKVKDFMLRLYSICERTIPKKNSMFILGRPNSGKTFFIDMVAGFYLNIGNVKNVVRGQNFPFNDCVNRRLLIWNEPSIMPSGFDSVKMLAGGDPCPTAVKYQGDATITRTPLIFTSNRQIFNKEPVWTSRIAFEEWSPCSILKTITGYPHPKTYIYLVNKYVQ